MFKAYRRFRDALRPVPNQTDLSTILKEMSPALSFEKRVNALKLLISWLRLPAKLNEEVDEFSHIHWKNVRFKFLLQFLEHHPAEKENFVETLRAILSKGMATRLFCMTGVAENSGFWSELSDRFMQRTLPQVFEDLDLADMVRMIFVEEEDAEWFETSSDLIVPALKKLFGDHNFELSTLIEEIRQALIILGAQISSLGVGRGLRTRLKIRNLYESPFVSLNRTLNVDPDDDDKILQEISHCNLALKEVRDQADSTGVSVDLIYNLERLSALLQRVEMLILLRDDKNSETRDVILAYFIAKLIRDDLKRLSLVDFLHEHLQMLTKKIVERSGEKGDHYIASSPDEKRELFWAASGAGILTAFTAVLKVFIGFVHFSLLLEGFLYFANYALGFLLMQRWHLALSSKQPAFMASALSRKFESFMQTKELADISSEIKKIAFSQFIASLANLLWVIPMVMFIDWAYFYVAGSHIITVKYAHAILEKHNLLTSGTFFYAAFTGVLLWASSVIAGWIENWIVFRNIPQILKESHVLHKAFGKESTRKIADKFAPTVGAGAGNISIAFLLAAPLIIGKFTGLPLDIRHVTLATGTITLALNTIPWDVSIIPIIISMLISILTMGCLNFGVSFYCAIQMAALARGVRSKYLRVIFKYTFTSKAK